MNSNLILWQNPEQSVMPSNIETVDGVLGYANNNLTVKQQQQIVRAFDQESYEMAAEYAWRKAITKLRQSLASLGIDFIGELLQRSDINESTSIDDVVSERTAIDLAERLGIIGKTGALKLRQSQELMAYFLSGEADAEIEKYDAFGIIKNSVMYILSEQSVDVAVSFSNFRKRILSETISLKDGDVMQIIAAPLFYIRTVCTILLSAIKREKGAHQEHALTNINIILPEIWNVLAESDKYHIGEAYRDVSASGDNVATRGLKQVLSKVKGFDYVPETLRSTTFREYASKVIEIHYGYDNYYREPAAIDALASLGSIIPQPAFPQCMSAYLLVYLGNQYGKSEKAAPIAEKELCKISVDRWRYYFTKLIHYDEYLLSNLFNERQVERFASLLRSVGFGTETSLPKNNQLLYNAIINGNHNLAKSISLNMYNQLSSR